MPAEDKELEREDEWDWDSAEWQRPADGARAIIAVPFTAEDHELVDAAADRLGIQVTEFIRLAALERARAETPARTQSA